MQAIHSYSLPSVDDIVNGVVADLDSTDTPSCSVNSMPTIIQSLSKKNRTKVVAYCRVSKDNDDQLSSIKNQRTHFLSVIAQHSEWEFAGMYCDVVSGTKKEGRPQLTRMLSDCKANGVGLVLVKSVSRLARNTSDLLQMVRDLAAGGTNVLFEREGVDTRTADSELILTILASLAEDESHEISQNSRWGLQQRFEDGTYRTSSAPYGYDLVDGAYAINKSEAEVVRLVFAWAAEGRGNRAIADELNRRNVPTKRCGEVWKGRPIATQWSSTQIFAMLKNEAYVGDRLLHKTYRDDEFNRRVNHGVYPKHYLKDQHPAIVDRRTYAAVRKMADKRTRGRQVRATPHAFSGMLFCGCCGSRMRREATKSAVYWVCKKHRHKAALCSQKNILESQVEDGFVRALRSVAEDPSQIEGYRREVCEEFGQKHKARLSSLERRKTDIRIQLTKLDHTAPKNALERASLISRQNELLSEDCEIQSELCRLQDRRMDGVDELLRCARDTSSSTLFDQTTFARFVSRVTIYGREGMTFHFHCGYTCEVRNEES